MYTVLNEETSASVENGSRHVGGGGWAWSCRTLVMMSLNWPSFQASVGWFIMVMMALSNSSYLSYRKTSSAHRWACSAALNT